MTAQKFAMNEETIFAAALKIKSLPERKKYLEDVCAENAELRAEVEGLLQASEAAGSFLNHPPADVLATEELGASECETDKPGPGHALPALDPCDTPGRIGKLGIYEIIEVVGQGGMGTVMRAWDTKLNRVVAVKVLSSELAANPTAVKRFVREAQSAAAVVHDHVVTIHAIEDSYRPPFLVMEFIEGQTLQQKIEREGALPLEKILRIGQQAAAGLAAAHKHGTIHRDVKPANILLENGVERVKFTDFGLARAANDVSITQTGQVAGTPAYMSPEQASGEPIDHRSDLFSLGSVLYAMCTGRPPFRAESTMGVLRRVCDHPQRPIREVNGDVPDWLAQIVDRLLQKQPADRFQTAHEVSELLSRCLAHVQHPTLNSLPTIPSADSPTNDAFLQPAIPKAPKPGRKPSHLGWMAAAIAFLIVVGLLLTTEATGVTQFASTIYRIASGEGTLVVKVNDPSVKVTIDGQDVVITQAGVNELRVRAGQHTIAASKDGSAIQVDREVVTVLRGEQQMVTVSYDATAPSAVPDPTTAKPEAAAPNLRDWGKVIDPHSDTQFIEKDGKLTMSLPEGNRDLNPLPGWHDLSAPRVLRDVEGDFVAQVRVGMFPRAKLKDPHGRNSYFGAGLILWQSPERYVRMFRASLASGQDGRPRAHAEAILDGKRDQQVVYVVEDATWLQIERKGAKVYLRHSPDGVNWTLVHTVSAFSADAKLEVGVAAVNTTGRPFAAVFDELSIESLPPGSSADILTCADWEWTAPENLGPQVNSPGYDAGPSVSADGLTLLFGSRREGGEGDQDLWMCTRTAVDQPWSAAVNLGPKVNSEEGDYSPVLSADGLTLLFDSTRAGGFGHADLWMCTRTSPDKEWSFAKNLGPAINTAGSEASPRLSPDGLTLFFDRSGEGDLGNTDNANTDIWACNRTSATAPWSAPRPLDAPINLPSGVDSCANLTADGLAFVFTSIRLHDGRFEGPLWLCVRSSRKEPWSQARKLGSVDTSVGGSRGSPFLSADGQTLYFESQGQNDPGYCDLWMSRRVRKVTPAPMDSPNPTAAPFDAQQASQQQDAWAKHLGAPVELTNSIGMKLRLIPPGKFIMGSSAEEQRVALAEMEQTLRRVDKGDEQGRIAYIEYLRPLIASEGPAHPVTLTEPFYLGSTEVTSAQFEEFVRSTDYVTSAEADAKGGVLWKRRVYEQSTEFQWRRPGRLPRTENHPVTQVSWTDARTFCEWLSEKEGRIYTLPTEAQWEYACRAGTQTPWTSGADPAALESFAWGEYQTGGADDEYEFHEVAQKQSNGFGLFDMHGNVQEWCQDYYAPTSYGARAETDPLGPEAPDVDKNHSIRGGAIFQPYDLRSAIRRRAGANYAENGLGFRVAIVGDLAAPPQAEH